MAKSNDLIPFRGAISPWSNNSLGFSIMAIGGQYEINLGSNSWPSGSLAIFVPFYVQQQMTVKGIYWQNGATVAGQVDAGIFDQDGNKIYSTGPVTQSGTQTMQMNVLPNPVHLAPGIYYIGLAAGSGTATFLAELGGSVGQVTGTFVKALGMAQAVASYPLPQLASLISVGQGLIPDVGITTNPLI